MAEIFFSAFVTTIVYCIILCAIHQHNSQNEALPYEPAVEAMHLLKAFVIVVGIFAMTWLPYCLVAEVSMQLEEEYIYGPTFIAIYKAVTYLLYVNSAANPVIYSLRIPSFRHGVKALLCGDRLKTKGGQLSQQCQSSDVVRNPAADTGGVSIISFSKQ